MRGTHCTCASSHSISRVGASWHTHRLQVMQSSSADFLSPTTPVSSRAKVLAGYLDYFRAVVIDKASSLDDGDLRLSRLPSGWTPLELLNHLAAVERRWLVWGFEGTDVEDPWCDHRDDRWWVAPDRSRDSVLESLAVQGEISRAVIGRHELDEIGEPGERWDGADPATLERVLLHLLQEYARHTGHLDVVVEMAGGRTGEE